MTKRTKGKATRTRHSQECKDETLKLAEQVGVRAAAEQLGLHDSQLNDWRSKSHSLKARGEVNDELTKENARLRRIGRQLSWPIRDNYLGRSNGVIVV